MAELVQRNIELSLADLQPMETNGICSQQEVIQILKKRSKYEYKLLRKPPRKADYLSYIQYEVYLYMLFSKRKSSHTDRSKNTPLGKAVYSANRIHILFTRLLKRFKSDLRLWLQYADFCKRARHYSRLSKCITKAIRIHPRCSGLWSLGAWTALSFDSDTHAARALLLTGLRMLPDDQHLWLELCRLEMLHTYKVHKRQAMLKLPFFEETDDNSHNVVMSYTEARLVYTHAIEQIPNDLEFRCRFIQLLRDYKDTEALQDLVYHGLKEEFADDPMVWSHLAKQPVFRYMDTHSVEWNDALNACESDVEQIFEEGIEMFPASGEIWEGYLKFKLEIISSVDVHSYVERVQSFKQTISKLNDSGVSSENIQTMLSNFLEDGNLVKEISDFLSEINSNVTSLMLDSMIDGNFELYSQVAGTFRLEKDLTLVLSKERVDSMLDQLYNWSLRYKHRNIGDLILKLFQWSAGVETIQAFRSRYNKVLVRSGRKWPLELYLFCSGVEKECKSIDKDEIELLFEKMISLHGADEVNVWLEYIEVKKLLKDFTGVGDCYWRAKKTLNPSLVEEFINRYTVSSLS